MHDHPLKDVWKTTRGLDVGTRYGNYVKTWAAFLVETGSWDWHTCRYGCCTAQTLKRTVLCGWSDASHARCCSSVTGSAYTDAVLLCKLVQAWQCRLHLGQCNLLVLALSLLPLTLLTCLKVHACSVNQFLCVNCCDSATQMLASTLVSYP